MTDPANRLNVPVPRAKGMGNCCCSPCHVRTGCDMISAGGIPLENGFFGLCCKCLPRRVAISLWIDDIDTCGCLDAYVSPYAPAAVAEAEWDCDSNSYSVVLRCFDRSLPDIDVTIGFEQDYDRSSPCFAVLRSDCMAYNGYDEVRTPLGGVYHDSDTRRHHCLNLGLTFPVDIARCLYTCSNGYNLGRITIEAADYVSRPAKQTGFWDGYEECLFTRACITYKDGYVTLQRYACLNDTYLNWFTEFDELESPPGLDTFPVTVTLVLQDPTRLQLGTVVPLAYGEQAEKQATCPDMMAEWELETGAIVSIRGDRRADCTDCRCWCRCICIEYFNSETSGVFRGTACIDDYGSGWIAELVNVWDVDAEPISVAVTLECDECTGETLLTYNGARQSVVCPDVDAGFVFEESNGSTTYVNVRCNRGAPCFGTFSVPTGCCSGPFPNILYATLEPDNPDEPGYPGNGSCTSIDGFVIPLEFSDQLQLWEGRGRPFPNCQDVELILRFSCKSQYPVQFELEIVNAGHIVSSDSASCDPLIVVFKRLSYGASDSCCEVDNWGNTNLNHYKLTVTE